MMVARVHRLQRQRVNLKTQQINKLVRRNLLSIPLDPRRVIWACFLKLQQVVSVVANAHPPIKDGIPNLFALANYVAGCTSSRVPISKKVLYVPTQNRKRRSLGVGWVSTVFLYFDSHVALRATVTVLLKLVNNATIAKVIFVVNVDPVLRAKIVPSAKPSPKRGFHRHFALAIWAVHPVAKRPGHP
jgi:hypothetical protein